MSASLRIYIAVLMSLLLLVSGSVSAMSLVAGLPIGADMSDCGASMTTADTSSIVEGASVEEATANKGAANNGACGSVAGTVCLNPGNMSPCVVLFALGFSHKLLIPELAARSVSQLLDVEYQNPDLAVITPPPELHA
ncbi:hypothetical protein [Marinobacter fonticola]|uniref:hypothetical protein n=1 Tax=Marinobacter fonticola TaxID=2603215 RepID=UPI0011E82A4E|nr:hypothetical protein [Marinobacter fonticola]